MIGLEIHCAREECKKPFRKVTHNQKYCSSECCKVETNRKVMENYHRRVAIKKGAKRPCLGCGTILSRYNEGDICGSCESAKRHENVGEAAQLVASVAWL